jgi:hypothetical protein
MILNSLTRTLSNHQISILIFYLCALNNLDD